MPIFEYICKKCDHQFEALVYGQQNAECPKCHGSKLAPQPRYLRSAPKAPPVPHRPPAPAVPVAIPAGRGPARFPI